MRDFFTNGRVHLRIIELVRNFHEPLGDFSLRCWARSADFGDEILLCQRQVRLRKGPVGFLRELLILSKLDLGTNGFVCCYRILQLCSNFL